jgi:hypothetical protein
MSLPVLQRQVGPEAMGVIVLLLCLGFLSLCKSQNPTKSSAFQALTSSTCASRHGHVYLCGHSSTEARPGSLRAGQLSPEKGKL